ncbi:hypothetical protein [Aquicoccus sp. SU-CL01552]|uniref:hypothetical protein n=1 Tax=Aquicoccus sp. SU-CL01552 TaxID=3127656 RepID=UPI003104C3E8
MPCETDFPSMPMTPPAPLALCCAERCALMDTSGEGVCFQLDWLDDLHRNAHAHHDAPPRPR